MVGALIFILAIVFLECDAQLRFVSIIELPATLDDQL